MMSNVFEPVRIKGKLFAKNTTTGSIAPKDTIRHIQLLNAEKNREVLVVSATGRVTRVPAADMGVALTPPPVAKLSFMQAKQVQDPEDMFKNIERLTKMVGRGIQPSLVITGGAGTGKTHLVKSTLEQMGFTGIQRVCPLQGSCHSGGIVYYAI
jgi:DNA replication protein DnaC